jgi:hypothetical protein
MNGHLNDEQWAAAVVNQNDTAAAIHLAECAACRDEVNFFARASAAARADARKLAEQPESFWHRQRHSVSTRIRAREFTHPRRRWIWATATLTLILLASALLTRNTRQPAATAAPTDPDDVLLLSVQRSVQSDLPQALRPAALLTQEMSRAMPRRDP